MPYSELSYKVSPVSKCYVSGTDFHANVYRLRKDHVIIKLEGNICVERGKKKKRTQDSIENVSVSLHQGDT